jgi:hypothetical protein
MDSKIVSRELWKATRLLLKDSGWTSFTSRTARRFGDSHVDVINFQSFNSYLASAIGTTTYSFSVRLGCFVTAIPGRQVKLKGNLAMPEEYECHLRYTIRKKLAQPECPRTDVFYVDPRGKYLSAVVEGVRQGLLSEGLSWFRRFSDMREVLRTLLEDDETDEGTWGFGTKASPARNLYAGYVALSLGNNQIAAECLKNAANSPSFQELRQWIDADLSRVTREVDNESR